MDAPKCRICGKREFNHSCSGGESLSNLPPVHDAPKPLRTVPHHGLAPASEYQDPTAVGLEGRVEALEKLVAELCEGRRKRSEYMKGYMREYRK